MLKGTCEHCGTVVHTETTAPVQAFWGVIGQQAICPTCGDLVSVNPTKEEN